MDEKSDSFISQRFEVVSQRAALVIAAVLIATLGATSALPLTQNMSWTPLVLGVWIVLWFFSAQRGYRLFGWVILISSAAVVLISLGQSGASMSSVMYLGTLVAYISSMWIRIQQKNLVFAQCWIFGASLFATALLLLSLIIPIAWIGRSGQTVLPLVVGVLLFMRPPTGVPVVLSLAATSAIFLQTTLSTARSASALVIVAVVLWAALDRRAPWQMRLAFASSLGILGALVWALRAENVQRLFGNDASLRVGPVILNGEGRASAQQVLDAVSMRVPEDSGMVKLLGHGAGSAHDILKAAGHPFDAPHNEFLRFWNDGGALGLALMIAVLLATVIIGFRAVRRRDLPQGGIALVVAASLTLFSATDNVIGYTWFMIPAAIIISWCLSSPESKESRGSR